MSSTMVTTNSTDDNVSKKLTDDLKSTERIAKDTVNKLGLKIIENDILETKPNARIRTNIFKKMKQNYFDSYQAVYNTVNTHIYRIATKSIPADNNKIKASIINSMIKSYYHLEYLFSDKYLGKLKNHKCLNSEEILEELKNNLNDIRDLINNSNIVEEKTKFITAANAILNLYARIEYM